MLRLTYKDTYLLSLLKNGKKEAPVSLLSRALLGLYSCDFLDWIETKKEISHEGSFKEGEKWIDEYFFLSGDFWKGKNLLFPALEKLLTLNLIEYEQKELFTYFGHL